MLATHSAVGVLAQQQRLTYGEIIHMKQDLSHWSNDQRVAASSALAPMIRSPSKASVQKTLFDGCGFNMQYYQLSGRNQRYSFVLRAKISRSYVIFAQLSGPFFGVGSSVPFNISIRNLIPGDAEIVQACWRGDSEGVTRLFQSGSARPNDVTPSNDTPLSVSLSRGFTKRESYFLADCNKGRI